MLKKYLEKYLSSEFFRQVFTLTSGSFLAQLIPVLATLLLTRLFSAQVFGIYFVYTSIIGILAVLSTLRFEMAVMLPDNDTDAANIAVVGIFSSLIISLISLVGLIFLDEKIITLLNIQEIGYWLYLVPVSVFLIGSFQILTYWSNRQKKYNRISGSKINRASVSSLGQIITGLSPVQNIGMIPGLIVGQVSSTLSLFYKNIQDSKQILKSVSLQGMKKVLKKYSDIPVFNTMLSVINTLSSQLPFYLLPRFFGTAVVGYYGLSNKIIRTPVTLLGESIGQVAYRKASELLNQGKSVYNLVKNNYIHALKLSFIPYLILFLFAPKIFMIFGKEWVVAGEYTQIMTPYLFFAFLNSTNPFLITLLNKQNLFVIYDASLLIARFLSIYFGYHIYQDVKIVLILYSAVGLLFNIILTIIILILAKRSQYIIRYKK